MSQKKSTNPFTEYYKTITNTELIIILDNPDKYQQEAVEAANLEFNDRNLSDEQIAEARAPLIAKNEEKERQKEKIASIKQKAINAGDLLIDTLNPIQPTKPGTNKIILTISLVYGILTLFILISNWTLIPIYIAGVLKFPSESLSFLIPMLLLVSGTFLFWRKMKFGWILMVIFTTWSTAQSLRLFIDSFSRESYGIMNFVYQRQSPVLLLSTFIFFGATAYVICKREVREVYRVEKKKMIITIAVIAMISFFSLFEDVVGVLIRTFG